MQAVLTEQVVSPRSIGGVDARRGHFSRDQAARLHCGDTLIARCDDANAQRVGPAGQHRLAAAANQQHVSFCGQLRDNFGNFLAVEAPSGRTGFDPQQPQLIDRGQGNFRCAGRERRAVDQLAAGQAQP